MESMDWMDTVVYLGPFIATAAAIGLFATAVAMALGRWSEAVLEERERRGR